MIVPTPVSAAEEQPLFADLGLSESLMRAVEEMGYRHPTPIQAQAIPFVLMGRDVLGVAQTGTGKTASFTLPLLDILSGSRARARMPRSLILEPTRELALQVAENFVQYGKYLKLTHALLIGGESMAEQREALMRGVDVLIATPGRLLDLFERGGLLLTQTSTLVIDEADRMLDMGFIPDVERIVSLLSPNRQTLFFSATMAPEIRRLADTFLSNPKEITVARPSSVATTIETGLVLVDELDKRRALRRLLRAEAVSNALIFCNRKRDVDILHKSLGKHGFSVGALHGDLPQSVRFATLEKFKAGELQLLVCSDVAARGIDIGGLSHVFNFDVPIHAEDYVHRIGRTGRAGRTGHAYTIAAPDDYPFVQAIESLTGKPIPPLTVEGIETAEWSPEDGDGRRRRRGGNRNDKRRDGRRDERRDGRKNDRPGDKRAADTASEPETEARRTDEVTARPARQRDDRQRDERQRQDRPRDEQPRESRDDRSQDSRNRDDRARDDRFRDDRRGGRDRDRRFRQDDLGPSVLGFGDEVPAFMRLPFRSRTPMDEIADGGELSRG
ncbi:DEAD/DEAH box helicase [Rhizosaccharibacter radicis]|uniref:DEAD/DEAH box helicase n=1 Tax=Rhizosaccharibacter radicis TaxID=2782605 RepID=A0ABT1VYH9_9PROT|nr:DEAD/DEAH box helicase [Acetobacteraceae bacterium KSS12]